MTNEELKELKDFRLKHWNSCSLCGHSFSFGDPLKIGYSPEGTKEIACQKCFDKLSRSYDAIFFPLEYSVPEDDTIIWRYIDFSKYVSMLEDKTLFFTRADNFEDPFEGARGYAAQETEAYREWKNVMEYKLRAESDFKITDSDLEIRISDELSSLKQKYCDLRKHFYISCWHENSVESEAMWKLYTSVLNQGVAIRTTIGRLNTSLQFPDLKIGRISYIDYDKPLSINNCPFWYKRVSFNHEKEIRAIFESSRIEPGGIGLPVDLNILIDSIYVSPLAPTWFFELVKKVSKKYSVAKDIKYSKLSDSPLF